MTNIKNIVQPSIEYLEKTDHPIKVDYKRDELVSLYWQYHQRLKAFKIFSKKDATILDIGGGSGGINCWKKYLTPHRDDLKIHAVDLFKGELFDQYKSYKLINLDNDDIPYEENAFDFIMMSHLIEHVNDWKSLINKCDKVLRKGGIMYIETPSIHTTELPTKAHYESLGYHCTTINFYDDSTHLKVVDLDEVSAYAETKNMITVEKGFCRNPFLEDYLIAAGLKLKDSEITSYGLWSKLLFASYVVLQKS